VCLDRLLSFLVWLAPAYAESDSYGQKQLELVLRSLA